MACQTKQKAKVEKPNIFFILADNGMVFTDGYTEAQVCSPSRATLMTEQFTARHGITDWISDPAGEDWRTKNRHTKMLPAEKQHMDINAVTLPTALKKSWVFYLFRR